MSKFLEYFVRFVYLILALAIPGTFVVLAVLAVGRFLYKFLKIARPKKALPLRSESGEVLYDWPDWHRHAKEEYPKRYFVTETVPRWFMGVWYVLLDALRRKEKNYQDEVLTSCFTILVDFVKASPWVLEEFPEDWEDNHIEAERWHRVAELRSLYEWWTGQRPLEYQAAVKVDPDARQALLDGLTQYDQYMLTRFINARQDLI